MIDRALPTGRQKLLTVRSMFDAIAPRYERVNRLLTFGLDARWRQATLSSAGLSPRSLVLDLACGTGDFCRLLEAAGHRAIGIDLSIGMLDNARTDAPLVQADTLALPFADASVDAVMCGFGMRNFVDLNGFFAEVARVVRPGGQIAFLDAYVPSSRLLRMGHHVYFDKIVPVIGGLLSGNREAYSYLPKSVGYMPEPRVVIDKIASAGFVDVRRNVFLGGAAHAFIATRSPR